MSAASKLTQQKIDRLFDYLKTGSLKKSCKKFKIKEPAFRESITDVAKALLMYYAKPNEHFVGDINHTKDIYANSIFIYTCYERFNSNQKPNSLENEDTVNEISFNDAKKLIEHQFNGKKIPKKDMYKPCSLTWFDLIIQVQVAVNSSLKTK